MFEAPHPEGHMRRITADMLISDVLEACPGSAAVFERHGLACPACLASGMESVSAVATVHDVSLEALIADLDRLTDEDPSCAPRKES
jgi:hybrid cluster-associated redox disulfide protein